MPSGPAICMKRAIFLSSSWRNSTQHALHPAMTLNLSYSKYTIAAPDTLRDSSTCLGCIKRVRGSVPITGATVFGTDQKTLSIRGVGASFGQFGGQSVMLKPKLTVYRESVKVAENDNSRSDPALRSAATAVEAFPSCSSRDAAIVLVAEPGSYTAQ